MKRFDVAVVGGGPAGSRAAYELAVGGVKVILFERSPGAPLRCAGIISTIAKTVLGIPDEFVLEELKGAVVHGPLGAKAILTAPVPKAVVIDRNGLDVFLRRKAREAGVEVWEGVSAIGLDGDTVHTTAGTFGAEMVVGADGPVSTVARYAGLPRPREILVGCQAEVKAKPRYPGHAEIFLDPGIAPGLFAWAVPAGELMRVGLATNEGRRARELLRSLLVREFPRCEVVRFSAGLIPIGPPPRVATERIFLVGDAAAQTKPLTGGGIYYGGLAATTLGRLIAQGEQYRYEDSLREGKVGEEIRFGLKMRQVFLDLSPSELDYLVSLLRNPELREFLITRGDMDRPSQVLRELRRAPHLWPLGLKALRALGGISRFARFLG